MKVDFNKFAGALPYASELYGVYQPLLGWRSRRLVRRFHDAGPVLSRPVAESYTRQIRPLYSIEPVPDPVITDPRHRIVTNARDTIETIGADRVMTAPFAGASGAEVDGFSFAPGVQGPTVLSVLPTFLDSGVGRALQARLRDAGTTDPGVWDALLAPDGMRQLVQETEQNVRSAWARGELADTALVDVLARESRIAGSLVELHRSGRDEVLQSVFTSGAYRPRVEEIKGVELWLGAAAGDRRGKPSATLSPIGIVHLFREYFFEFDTFLGTPVQHVWLSPGATVELVEISTRRVLTERATELSQETTQKSEQSEMLQDELSDAVKDENQNTTKFGVSVDSTSNLNLGTFTTNLEAKATYDSEDLRKTAREQTHKQLRQQTIKLSSEIKKSFKSTFKTVVETTDTSSKRYLMQNTSDHLVNYELRRKMRQVGVQVQDIGTQLCWQAYVDREDAADQLGVAKLIHIGQPPQVNIEPPELLPRPVPYSEPIERSYSGDGIDESYNWPQPGVHLSPKRGFEYGGHGQVEYLRGNIGGETVDITQNATDPNVLDLVVHGPAPDDENVHVFFRFTVNFVPTAAYIAEIEAFNQTKMAAVNAEKIQIVKEAFFAAAQDRVNAAMKVKQRPFEDLRQEERIIVYRGLIRQLFHSAGLSGANHRAQHLAAELVQSMFDVDKMLYFVAPEWWMPRTASGNSPQNLGFVNDASRREFEQRDTVGWDGAETNRPDNYYITGDSEPAKLGSSLGWVLQLDGDNLRNAFLNAPWVKAVIPIRLGREMEALDWLTDAGVEGVDGLDDLYQEAIPGERGRMLAVLHANKWTDADLSHRYETISASDITLHDAIRYLALIVTSEYDKSRTKVSDKLPDGTPANYLPPDKVFERGFDSLEGGFEVVGESFKVFSQWIEVLPTDQIVPVEVHYDPKTGMQT